MKKQKLGLALAALCVPLVGATALTGSAFAEGETPTMYSASDFGGDEAFFSCIKSALSVSQSAVAVSAEAVGALTSFSCYGSDYPGIKTVSGINLFTSLTGLYLKNQDKLESVDISGNSTLDTLNISYSGTALTPAPTEKSTLASVTMSGNAALKYITINDTKLKTLNLSGAPNAGVVDLFNNELETINLSNNTAMYFLVASNNKLNSIDLSKNTSLTIAYLYGNSFESIDVSKINNNLLSLFLDDNVLVRTNFIAVQIEKGSKYYSSIKTNGGLDGPFIAIMQASGLSGGYSEITTPNAYYYKTSLSDTKSNCYNYDPQCLVFDADITNYQNYIQLRYTGKEAPTQDDINAGKDSTKRNYRLEINLQAYDPNILVPDTGFFTGEIDGTKAIIYVGAAVLGAGALYLAVYSAKRSLHRNRFRK